MPACCCCRSISLRPLHRLLLALCLAMLAAGCAPFRYPSAPPLATHLTARNQAGVCARYFAALDQAVDDAGVADRQASRIPGFPYLRINRFLVSFANQNLESKQAVDAWVNRMLALDRESREAEISNLPASMREDLRGLAGEADLRQAMKSCGKLLLDNDLATSENFPLLRGRAKVLPSYSTLKSVLGLYPLTAPFVRLGIAHYHRSVMKTYRTALSQLPVNGNLIRYAPRAACPSADEAQSIIRKAARDALGIPLLTDSEKIRLFLAHAPVWEIDVDGDFDRPGTPYWSENRLPAIDSAHPRVYTLLSHTRYQGEVLLQLNYIIWFPERPRQGAIDLFGGRLDGLIWRVTLDRQGSPILYDTIHSCGCYHMFFPGPGMIGRQQKSIFNEPLLVPQQAPRLTNGARMIIRVENRTHYIDRIYAEVPGTKAQTVTYELADYDVLRSLPTENDGHRSLFGPDALVPGTERGERWLLWPTGVPSPGAMRQWGNHATAFFGRRHFDDPALLEQLFSPHDPNALLK